jgi:hypothetical protein
VVLPSLQGKRPVRQRSLSAESIFVTFDASKVMGPCGQEQTMLSFKHKLLDGDHQPKGITVQ